MAVPSQMYEFMLNARKGWPTLHALDFKAKISANVLYDLPAGRACHINDDLELEPGVVNTQMALFNFQGKNELDVNSEASAGNWYPITPSGNVMCLVATGAFELETTEFDDTQTYLPNEPLRAPTGNALVDEDVSGKLTNQSVVLAASATPGSATAVCAVVSIGVHTNAYGKEVLAFWPVWYPGVASET